MTFRAAVVTALLVAIDQLTKFLVSANLKLGESVPVLEGVIHMTRVHNTGVAFGFFKGMLLVFVFISVVVIFFVILCARRFRQSHGRLRLGLQLILGGTVGNLIDRIRLGYVVDFIDLRVWPVFNVADLAITAGGALLIYHIIRKQDASHII